MSIPVAAGADPFRLRPLDPAVRRLGGRREALAAAHDLARDWAGRAADLDRTGAVPHAAMRALELSGLLAVTVPKAVGGPGLTTVDLIDVFVVLASADLALAQVPQNHFDFVDTLRQAPPDTRAFFYEEVLRGARFGNALAEPGRRSRRDLATTIVEEGNGYRISGRKFYSTGALTAPWVPVHALHADGRIRTAYVRRDAPGLTVDADWNAFGQRATFSGTTHLDGVWVPREHVVDRSRGHPAFLLAQFAGNQLIHPAIEVGAARGALVRAADRLLARRPGPDDADGDWGRLGRAAAQIEAARALVTRAARLVDAALAFDEPDRDRAIAAAIAVDEAKSLAYEIGPLVTGRAVADDPTAVGSIADFDRSWRNARTHSLHDPVRWRQHQVGDFHVNGRLSADLVARFNLPSTLPTQG